MWNAIGVANCLYHGAGIRNKKNSTYMAQHHLSDTGDVRVKKTKHVIAIRQRKVYENKLNYAAKPKQNPSTKKD
jgi:hypothetical protein